MLGISEKEKMYRGEQKMNKTVKRFLFVVILLCGMWGKESKGIARTESSVVITEHNSDNQYGMGQYRYTNDTIDCYLVSNNDGTLTRVEYVDSNYILLETFNEQLKLMNQKNIPLELELFGGFFSGSAYNWIVFGQKNETESDAIETFRIVKYTKEWERLESCSLYGANTVVPFDFGSLRMAENEGRLYIRTSHKMYQSKDGLNHQANVTIEVEESPLQIIGKATMVSNSKYGYVSHSFDQFIDVTDGVLTALDLGDAYPRQGILFRYNTSFLPYGEERSNNLADSVELIPIASANTTLDFAYNITGVSIGGYEVSDSHYLTAYSSVDQSNYDNQVNSDAVWNIYISSLSRNSEFSSTNRYINQITSYPSGQAGTPQLVKLSPNRFLLLWEFDSKLHYVFLDGSGSMLGNISIENGNLSECKPIVHQEKVIWYTCSREKGLTFYQIDMDGKFTVLPYTYLLTLNTNGGNLNGKDILSEYVAYNTKYLLSAPIKKGYQFTGWSTNNTNGEKQGKYIDVVSDTNLYAQWKKTEVGKTEISYLKNSSSKTVRVKYNKISGAKGYQISYSQDKTFSSRVKKMETKNRTIDVKNLKSKCTYYVRVRAYTVDSVGNRVYGKWSKTMSITIKK